MVIPILYMLFILAYAVLPFLYKNERPAMLQFYLRMTWSRSFRRCYSLGMLATLMVWKSHATLTLLAKQDCPLWLQYD